MLELSTPELRSDLPPQGEGGFPATLQFFVSGVFTASRDCSKSLVTDIGRRLFALI